MGGSLSPALFEAYAERRDGGLLGGRAVLGLLAASEPPELVPAVVLGQLAGVALFIGTDVVEPRVSRSRSLPGELVRGRGEACCPSDVARRCESVGSGRETQEREF